MPKLSTGLHSYIKVSHKTCLEMSLVEIKNQHVFNENCSLTKTNEWFLIQRFGEMIDKQKDKDPKPSSC